MKLGVTALALLAAVVIAAGCRGTSSSDKTSTAAAKAPTSAATKPAASPSAGAGASTILSNVGKADNAKLTGAGATFPNPLYTRWFSDYKAMVAPGVEVNYQSIGSGGGVKAITEKTVDFGASDAPLSDTELAAAAGVQHIPTTLGAVVMTYNLDGVSAQLKFDGDTIAKIYLGKITKWNDPALAALNAGVTLPSTDIVVVHRSDGSGTSFVFTDYLSKVSADWKAGPGTSKNPQWPEGLGGQGNDGVTQQVQQNKNSIGYVELLYAKTNNLPIAQVKNSSGEFVTPSTDTTSLAASGVTIPDDYRVSIVNSPTKGAYPISSFTYILLYKNQTDAAKGKALVDLLWWAIHDGQKTTTELNYAPLPKAIVTNVEKTLTTDITSGGQPLLKP
ncbi:MAG: phosphate ABC transporter substrate-binding protein PstS [Chloroflexota bacterium]|nr:phosphate ABC transporter substrate-binding protein PstS [Chloroflexota bacterium]